MMNRSALLLPDGRYELREGERFKIVDAADLEEETAAFFTDEPAPVPESVTPLQMRKALRQMGLKAAVDAYIATLDEETVEEWEYALAIERGNPTLQTAISGMGWTEEQADDLFRLAATLA